MKSSTLSWLSAIRSLTIRRPVRQVVMATIRTIATTIGNHPPAGILNTFALKKARSRTPKGMQIASALAVLHPQRCRANE
jgi:hypothetical protein